MIPLVGAVLAASLLGSLHCIGMCGAFLAVAVGDVGEAAPSRISLQAAYHLGRLATYAMLGAISGTLGRAVDLGGQWAGVPRLAAAAAGAMMIVVGVTALLRIAGARLGRVPIPGWWQRLVTRGHRAMLGRPPLVRAAAIGLLTTLLPCGWLYAFVVTAGGTGHPAWGALTMGVFWIGTLPAMVGLGVGVQHLTGSLRRFLPLGTSVLLIIVGVAAVTGRMSAPAVATPSLPHPGDPVERVRALPSTPMPCCDDR